jgi:hypothetical protein
VTGRTKELRHSAGEAAGVEFEGNLHLALALAPVDILSETTKVNRLTPDLGALCIEIAGLDCMMHQRQCMEDARFSRAVGAVDKGDRS